MQIKKLIGLIVLKLVVASQALLMAALFGGCCYFIGWPVWIGATVGFFGAFVLIYTDDRESWSRRIMDFPTSTYLRPPPTRARRKE